MPIARNALDNALTVAHLRPSWHRQTSTTRGTRCNNVNRLQSDAIDSLAAAFAHTPWCSDGVQAAPPVAGRQAHSRNV